MINGLPPTPSEGGGWGEAAGLKARLQPCKTLKKQNCKKTGNKTNERLGEYEHHSLPTEVVLLLNKVGNKVFFY